MPKVIKITRAMLKKSSPNFIYVGRPTVFGNTWKIGDRSPINGNLITRELAVSLHLSQEMEQFLNPEKRKAIQELLYTKDLACWCHEWDGVGINPEFCHADLYLGMVNKDVDSPWHRYYGQERF